MTYISKSIQDNHLVTIDDGYRRSCMRFHMVPLSLTLSDIVRAIQVTGFQWPIYLQIYSR